jgi:glycosyltransferase involved in cell wall biosynthesis
MIISKELSNKILIISGHYKGKGGIAIVVNTLSTYYESFNYVASIHSRSPVMFWYFGICILKLFYYILIKRIKIVHIHGASYGSFVRKMIIINICRFFQIKIVYHIHGAKFNLFYTKYNKCNIVKNTINKADVLVVLSNSWQEFFKSVTDIKKIFVLNNIVEKPDFERSYPHNYLSIKFLFLGRIGDRKGIFDLLEIIKEYKEYLTGKFSLYIGGDGETDKLIEFIEKNDLHDFVEFEGWVSGEKKKELLAACDIYILPSYNEGLPISILEAMSYEMPVISTTVGGIPEVVSNNENGFLITPGDRQKLFECIRFFIENPHELERMGKKSAEIAARFYPEQVIPKLENIYQQLLATSNNNTL